MEIPAHQMSISVISSRWASLINSNNCTNYTTQFVFLAPEIIKSSATRLSGLTAWLLATPWCHRFYLWVLKEGHSSVVGVLDWAPAKALILCQVISSLWERASHLLFKAGYSGKPSRYMEKKKSNIRRIWSNWYWTWCGCRLQAVLLEMLCSSNISPFECQDTPLNETASCSVTAALLYPLPSLYSTPTPTC